ADACAGAGGPRALAGLLVDVVLREAGVGTEEGHRDLALVELVEHASVDREDGVPRALALKLSLELGGQHAVDRVRLEAGDDVDTRLRQRDRDLAAIGDEPEALERAEPAARGDVHAVARVALGLLRLGGRAGGGSLAAPCGARVVEIVVALWRRGAGRPRVRSEEGRVGKGGGC